jgi:hypothetical protein
VDVEHDRAPRVATAAIDDEVGTVHRASMKRARRVVDSGVGSNARPFPL